MRNVFISFDVSDERMVNLLRRQAKDNRFSLMFRDYSVKEPFAYGWRRKVENLIGLSSIVIVAIGRYTHRSRAVNWEIKEAHWQDKRVLGIMLHRNYKNKIPHAMRKYDKIINWNTYKIRHVLRTHR